MGFVSGDLTHFRVNMQIRSWTIFSFTLT